MCHAAPNCTVERYTHAGKERSTAAAIVGALVAFLTLLHTVVHVVPNPS